jgi:hypothetical protein
MEQWQKDDAARLKALFKKHTKLSQMQFGLTYDIGSQSAVGQYVNGLRPLNVAVAVKFARGLCVSVSAFSPTLARELAGADAMDPIGEVVGALPEDGQRQALDFLQYLWERNGGQVASERSARYVAMIESIKADMAQRRDRGD